MTAVVTSRELGRLSSQSSWRVVQFVGVVQATVT